MRSISSTNYIDERERERERDGEREREGWRENENEKTQGEIFQYA